MGGSKPIESAVFALGQDDLTINEVHAMRKRGRMVPIQLSVYNLNRCAQRDGQGVGQGLAVCHWCRFGVSGRRLGVRWRRIGVS